MELSTYKITDQKKFDTSLEDVTIEISPRDESSFYGIVTLHFVDGKSRAMYGQHGYNEFEEAYGFVIEKVQEVAQS